MSGGRERACSQYRKSLTFYRPILTFGSAGWHSSQNLNKINHYTIRGFDAAGNMVFTAELANRMVDSEAWVYRVNQSKKTFDANNYARVVSPFEYPSRINN